MMFDNGILEKNDERKRIFKTLVELVQTRSKTLPS